LDAIAALQGKVIQPGNVIAGFGPHDPPAPGPIPSAKEMYGDPIEPVYEDDPDDLRDEPTLAPSPLITRVSQHVARETLPVAEKRAPVDAEASLIVLDGMATYQGREVKLTASEQARVIYCVLRAILRSIREQEAEIAGRLPKRKRRVSSQRAGQAIDSAARQDGQAAGASSGESGPPLKKRRGRPPKVKS